jgi:hypothetical protein
MNAQQHDQANRSPSEHGLNHDGRKHGDIDGRGISRDARAMSAMTEGQRRKTVTKHHRQTFGAGSRPLDYGRPADNRLLKKRLEPVPFALTLVPGLERPDHRHSAGAPSLISVASEKVDLAKHSLLQSI